MKIELLHPQTEMAGPIGQNGAHNLPFIPGMCTCLVGLGLVLANVAMFQPVIAAEKPAKVLFGTVKDGARLPPQAYGFYTKGCLAGARQMPLDGSAWQVMRPKRNRNWGHPDLIDFLQNLAVTVKQKQGWPGLLFGDMSQPRGGPMLTGHASHQVGLDADVWMMPMPDDRRFSTYERNNKSAISMLGTKVSVDKTRFLPAHVKIIREAASNNKVARIFVHPAIKKALCEGAGWFNRGWLSKVRPWWGHHYHFHVRMKCPAGSKGCKSQPAPPSGDGCGKPLDQWFKMLTRPPRKLKKPRKKRKKRPPMTLAALPTACRTVLYAGRTDPASNRRLAAGIPLPVRKPF